MPEGNLLTVDDVARHFELRPDTVRRMVRHGHLRATRVGRQYRFAWESVWACENGPVPSEAQRGRYREPLLTKRRVADRLTISNRTIERWINRGMPTRNILGAVRLNPHDVGDWLRKEEIGVGLPPDWWRS